MKLSYSILLTLLLLVNDIYAQPSPRPWVSNSSRPYAITQGLEGHHLGVWASHGRYFDFKTGVWKWQRPQIFCTTEDLFTQTIVIPYLIPMLENAGANVFVPRERDWQTEEYVVDNDSPMSGYSELSGTEHWQKAPRRGFGIKAGRMHHDDRPFAMGTARTVPLSQGEPTAMAYYRPQIAKGGRYAVYVSYQTIEGSVDDAEYIVMHQGIATTFRVNQQMGSGTWVYLGTFDFDASDAEHNYVVVTNRSRRHSGFVTTDAVRFGGGMGNFERLGTTSGVPRAMEGAKYYTQYAGAPKAVTVSKGGCDDYGDDINCRALMANWLSYGSSTNPVEGIPAGKAAIDVETTTIAEAAAKAYLDSITKANIDSFGVTFRDSLSRAQADSMALAIADSIAKVPFSQINVMKGEVMTGRVPLELQLAIHSDAGYQTDFSSIYGSLAICTRDFNDKKLTSGQSRNMSYEFACDVAYGIKRDLQKTFGTWELRDIWDKNYSETRLPAQTSAILETLAHENFPDIRMGHDPYFKFTMARSIYKSILKYLTRINGEKAVVQPLTPQKFQVVQHKNDEFELSWCKQEDHTEKTSNPDAYILYTRIGDKGYDNGILVKSDSHRLSLLPNTLYRFRVTAINKGGESFPTEELVAMYSPEAMHNIAIINSFHRLSSPAVINNDSICGFDINDDIGLSYGRTPAWCGQQLEFRKKMVGKENGLGYSGNELMGRFTAGNDFNYAYAHARAMADAGRYNIVSMSSEVINEDIDLTRYGLIDLLFGNEKDDGHSLQPYKTFTPSLRTALERYTEHGGRLMVSGSYIASDMQTDDERQWLRDYLHIQGSGTDRDSLTFRTDSISDTVRCGDLSFEVYRHVNADHYASVSADIISFANSTDLLTRQPFMTYASGRSAAITHSDSRNRILTMGFPFECIKYADDRAALMQRILDFQFAQ